MPSDQFQTDSSHLIYGLDPEPPGHDLAHAAVQYAVHGWPVFPCVPQGKEPLGRLVPKGCLQASTDPEQVRKWWQKAPHANIGLATGIAFDVFDVDAGGEVGWRKLMGATADGRMPSGPTARTGHGEHRYFVPSGSGNRVGFVPKCDWRGLGGYVVGPPSIHATGHRYAWVGQEMNVFTDGEYRMTPLWSSWRTQLCPVPGWLSEALERPVVELPSLGPATRARRAPSRGTIAAIGIGDIGLAGDESDDALNAVLYDAAAKVALAAEGRRNSALNAQSYRIGRYVARGLIDLTEAADWLLFAADRASPSQAKQNGATVASGLRGGVRGATTVRPDRAE